MRHELGRAAEIQRDMIVTLQTQRIRRPENRTRASVKPRLQKQNEYVHSRNGCPNRPTLPEPARKAVKQMMSRWRYAFTLSVCVLAGAPQGVDLVPLIPIALQRVEVLRDGASAQYGSDAIAGVINFVFEDDPDVRRLQLQYGSTYVGDGDRMAVAGAFGTLLGSDGGIGRGRGRAGGTGPGHAGACAG